MDFLKKIIAIGRLHYEKILLILVLVILAGAVVYLNKTKEDEERKIDKYIQGKVKTSGSSVPTVDLTPNTEALKLVNNPPPLDFSLPHHLFNPVKWQRRPPPDDTLFKIVTGREVGWPKMIATRIDPLNFIVNLERVVNPGQYYVGITHEGAEKAPDRKRKQRFATLNAKIAITTNEFYFLKEIKGPPEDPTELVLEMPDGTTKISLSKDKPYTQVEGYEAELKYTIDGKTFPNLRVNSPLRFQGEDYIVVAITPNEVVVSARSNDKKYTVQRAAER